MLEYNGRMGEKPIKLCFVDEESPKEWKGIINDKLSEYYEKAYIDIKTEGSKDILVILELNPTDMELKNEEYIHKQKDTFEKYYDNILEEIGSSNQSLNENYARRS
ncbi:MULTISPECIES: hypothetical protein [Methanobacterium]|uniref:Uncharacterized protein n=1 Tax=Methanobacterium bryantii TaxID=2161 RepID=A0A2A2H6L1_METBR|nr:MULTISPECIES: hypothetical protein [Methanobacterium]OEC84952.1 hypothetical protein A9507_01065 [Methanobacterium sp. A39]PAV05101.1 hypothetical protein ASJ80_12485 [Methanobacterium bryantii]